MFRFLCKFQNHPFFLLVWQLHVGLSYVRPGCPAWLSCSSDKKHTGSGGESLWVRHAFLGPHFFSEYFLGTSYELSTVLLSSVSAWFLRGAVGFGVLCSPLEEGAMFDPWSTWRASWKLTQQQAARPLSLRYWDGWDYFLSGRTLYFSYWTFPCILKWENHSLNRQAQVIIKNALYQAAWQYLH